MEGPFLLRDRPGGGRQANKVQTGMLFADHGTEDPAHKLVSAKVSAKLHDRSFGWFQATPTRPIGVKSIPADGDRCGASPGEIVVETTQEELNAVLDE